MKATFCNNVFILFQLLIKKKRYLLSTVFFISIYLMYENYSQKNDEYFFYINYQSKFINNSEEINLNNEWIVNANIVQYSSYAISIKPNVLKIDVLALINYNVNDLSILRQNMKIIAKIKQNDYKIQIINIENILRIPFMKTNAIPNTLWRFSCKLSLNTNEINNNHLLIALIDQNEFKNELSLENIKYQKPTYINGMKEKIKGVAHCVHMLRNVNGDRVERLFNWLDMQFRIGISEISLYIHNVDIEILNLIKQNYEGDKVKLKYHKTDFNNVCKSEIRLYNKDSKSVLYKFMHDYCLKAYNTHFNLSNDLVSNAHERINTNDCFLNYKYQYEYVTNYDFDEIIFPRKFDVYETSSVENAFKNCNQSIIEKSSAINKTYNIYEYANRLFNYYGKNRLTSITFQNSIFIKSNINIELFFNQLFNNKEKFFIFLAKKFELKISQNSSINFLMKNYHDYEYSKDVYKLYNYAKCLKVNSIKNFEKNFNLFISIVMNSNGREGKSIFNTDNTESINQHYASNKKFLTYRYILPVNRGFTSHFREKYDSFFNHQSIPINYLLIDIEYYLFLLSYFK